MYHLDQISHSSKKFIKNNYFCFNKSLVRTENHSYRQRYFLFDFDMSKYSYFIQSIISNFLYAFACVRTVSSGAPICLFVFPFNF